jgi:hypothetical protein
VGSWIGGFVHPALLAGLGLATVPILIHLLNRQRHKPVPWAAMRFVLAAYRKTRRRVQMENLLLLLLRTAAIALIALAITRPFTGAKSPLAGLTESRRDVAIIVDGSASMGWREGVETAFEKAVARARDIVRSLEAGRGDRVRLVYAGQYPRLLSWTTPDQALAMLDTLSAPTDEPLDLAAALADVLQRVESESGGAPASQADLEVRLLTDMQRRAFLPEDAAATAAASAAKRDDPKTPPDAKTGRAALFEELDKLAALGIKVTVENMGGKQMEPPNLGVAGVEPIARLYGPGMPSEIGVEVRNFGPSPKNGVRVVLEVDGERRPNQTADIPARGRAQVVFPVVFKTAGEHVLTARLEEGDKLGIDNERSHVVSVPPPVRILLVNGAPGAVIEEDEVGFLKAVLEPAGDDQLGSAPVAPFEPHVVMADELGTMEIELSSYDVIWLANVESLPATVVDHLEQTIAAGKALIISLGDRVDAASYDARMFRADGTGLLPAEIQPRSVAVPSRSDSYFRVKWFDEVHPALSFFADERFKPLFTEIPVYEFFATRPIERAHVLATLDDDGSHPLLVERAYDRGRVFLWTTSIDPAWTRLSESPATLVPLVHEWLRYAARAEEAPRNVGPGTPLAAEVAQFPRNLMLVRPDGSRRSLDGDAQALNGGRWKLPVVQGKDTEKTGIYKIESEGSRAVSFAVCLDPFEGELDRISNAELHALHKTAFETFDSENESDRSAGPEDKSRGELWRGIAIACLIVLVLESLWAAWLGQKRSVRA